MVFRLPILFTGLGSLKTQKQRQNRPSNIFATPAPRFRLPNPIPQAA